MRQMIERKIDEVKAQPEHKRHRAVLIMTVLAGLIVIVVWLLLLLPAQLKLS